MIDHLTPTLLLQTLLSGVLLGLVYALMALGLSLTMGILGVVNVAHSTFIMLGSYLAFELALRWNIDPLLSIVVAGLIFFLLGALLEKYLIRRVALAAPTIGLLILFGVLVVIESVAILIWTTDTQIIDMGYGPSIFIGDLIISRARLLAGVIALLMTLVLHLLTRYTIWGKATRAMSQNGDAARMLGINVERLSMFVFATGTATAAIGGVTLAMIFPFTPQDHIRWLAWAFLVVVVGGLGNVRNTLFAGIFVGIIEAFSGILLPFQYVSVIVYSLLALALMIRGEGLAGIQRRTI